MKLGGNLNGFISRQGYKGEEEHPGNSPWSGSPITSREKRVA
ncbi:hypothetical protein Dd1591_4115 [Dickeya chrysanthemi Ech1591]|uniref:Uncharacterized protein n=1 Tax=Dickeya chrysanthemi (strain Ech1591) TaxID=561229 RepID=C6CQ34_DICC1|nr:hypothetical protein Dd1591_4115 [Dickeya chrysanthemi Ech1591]